MRRTKEESEQTRQQILAAARDMFARQGVTRTSLEQIAQAAGVTRGAIYWHFSNKTELFYAMREQVLLPCLDRVDLVLLQADPTDPLAGVERLLRGLINMLETDLATRQTFQIITFKCEYVGELQRELELQITRNREFMSKLTQAYRRAEHANQLRADLKPELVGLLRLWLMDEDGTLVRNAAAALIGAHIGGCRRRSPVAENSE
jgi:TetR/AcrR family transcriptional regulator, acrAB operon repressor